MATYNNAHTLGRVLDRLLLIVPAQSLIVINDGSTDVTPSILKGYEGQFVVLENEQNSGKGYSLRRGFKEVKQRGFRYALTIDSDGQHFPEDIPILLEALSENPDSVIMGSRNMQQEGVPQKSSFGNRFSNFWFKVETWISLPDTQTGFRIYPLHHMQKMRLFTRKFELEIELIVRLAWRGVRFIPVPIRVKYDPEERVSHFRPGRDFFRISVLNSVLVTIAFLFYYPKKFFSFHTLSSVWKEAVKSEESNRMKSLSLAFGVFMGIFPIWGFQLLVGIPLAVLFRMNKVLFIAAANISIPPMIPVIMYLSLLVGQYVVHGQVNYDRIWHLSHSDIGKTIYDYLIGACIMASMAFVLVFLMSSILFYYLRPKGRIKANNPQKP